MRRGTFGGHTVECGDLRAVDVLNLIRYGAAAMRLLATTILSQLKWK